jgi:tetratricopeptide (TPR) repeat protein
MKTWLSLLLTLFVCTAAIADAPNQTVTTEFQSNPELGIGAEFRSESNELVKLLHAKQLNAAEKAAVALCKKFEAKFDPARTQFVFSTRAEFETFKKTGRDKVEWIDVGYHQCLKLQAYIAAERKQFPVALAMLQKLEKIAPTDAGGSIEAGYVLGQMKRYDEALLSYGRAEATIAKYPAQRHFLAAAMRGKGFMLIELSRLDEAERELRKSLVIEPGNRVALNELEYIQELRAAK